jgi:signal transduction histidine kinase
MVKQSLRTQIILGFTLVAGVGLSSIAAVFVGKGEALNQEAQFRRQADNLTTVLQHNLNRYIDVLAFLKDHYRVMEGQVNRQEFTSLVSRSLQTYSGIQALEWAPFVPQTERINYEQAIQAEGYKTFEITELHNNQNLVRAGDRPYYIPVTYIAPFHGNEAAFGFDLHSDEARAIALQLARDTANVMATGRIRLVQEQRDQFGFLVVLPLYLTSDVPDSIEARQKNFSGVLVGVFRISDVIEEALKDLDDSLNFSLYDQNSMVNDQFLGRYDATHKMVTMVEDKSLFYSIQNSSICSTITTCTHTITVEQRQWQVKFSPPDHNFHYGASAILLAGFVLTISLVLFLYSLSTELAQMKRLSDLKLEFFSMASHELRTPLSTILLSAESLQVNHEYLSEEQRRANVQRIYRTAEHMRQQIADLLTLTRAEAGKQEFNPELLDLEPFFQQILEEVETGCHPPIIFTRDCQNRKAFWDKKLIRSLLTNLLSNAIKYSPQDTTIQFTLHCNDQTATLQICDSGMGIPTTDQPHLQNAFYRGSNVGKISGTGLGLAVVKTSVDLHRGEWQIQSQEGQGTTVTIKLPLEGATGVTLNPLNSRKA